jgi:hypothetical protein
VSGLWITVAALSAGTIAIKSAGPLALGGRVLGRRTAAVIVLVAPALLAALVVYEAFNAGRTGIRVDARVAGLAAAGGALALRLPILVVVAAAAIATALVRLL